MYCHDCFVFFFFFKQKTAYEMRISDWSSDVCSSDLPSGTFSRKREKGSSDPSPTKPQNQPFSCEAGEGGAQRRMRARAQRARFWPTALQPLCAAALADFQQAQRVGRAAVLHVVAAAEHAVVAGGERAGVVQGLRTGSGACGDSACR